MYYHPPSEDGSKDSRNEIADEAIVTGANTEEKDDDLPHSLDVNEFQDSREQNEEHNHADPESLLLHNVEQKSSPPLTENDQAAQDLLEENDTKSVSKEDANKWVIMKKKAGEKLEAINENEKVKKMKGVVSEYLSRMCGTWDLSKAVTVSDMEKNKISEMSKIEVRDDEESLERLYRVIAWRYTMILTIIPFGLLHFLINLLTSDDLEPYLTGFGALAHISNTFCTEPIILVGFSLALWNAVNLPLSSQMVRWCSLVFLFMKLWPSLMSNDVKVDIDSAQESLRESYSELGLLEDLINATENFYDDDMILEADVDVKLDTLFLIHIQLKGIWENALEIIPLIMAFPRGAIAAAFSVLSLCEKEAVTPKALLFFFFPFSTLIFVLSTSSIIQIAGDKFLALALLCFYTSDLLWYLSYNDLMKGDVEKLTRGKLASGKKILRISAFILLVIWSFVEIGPCMTIADLSDVDEQKNHCLTLAAFESTKGIHIINFILSYLRNLLLSKILFVDFILMMMTETEKDKVGFTYKNDKNHRQRSSSSLVNLFVTRNSRKELVIVDTDRMDENDEQSRLTIYSNQFSLVDHSMTGNAKEGKNDFTKSGNNLEEAEANQSKDEGNSKTAEATAVGEEEEELVVGDGNTPTMIKVAFPVELQDDKSN